jgi:hypothetical protein
VEAHQFAPRCRYDLAAQLKHPRRRARQAFGGTEALCGRIRAQPRAKIDAPCDPGAAPDDIGGRFEHRIRGPDARF